MVRASFGKSERQGGKKCSLVFSVICSVHDPSYPLSGVSSLSLKTIQVIVVDKAHIVTQLTQSYSVQQ
jgi:hypothetical protein